jgi:pimeloyl-ACP methyl ester carboxylesterase
MADMRDMDFFAGAAGYDGPVLLAYGSGDALMADGYAARYAALYPEPDVHVIGNDGHLFRDGARDEILDVTATHFERTLCME